MRNPICRPIVTKRSGPAAKWEAARMCDGFDAPRIQAIRRQRRLSEHAVNQLDQFLLWAVAAQVSALSMAA